MVLEIEWSTPLVILCIFTCAVGTILLMVVYTRFQHHTWFNNKQNASDDRNAFPTGRLFPLQVIYLPAGEDLSFSQSLSLAQQSYDSSVRDTETASPTVYKSPPLPSPALVDRGTSCPSAKLCNTQSSQTNARQRKRSNKIDEGIYRGLRGEKEECCSQHSCEERLSSQEEESLEKPNDDGASKEGQRFKKSEKTHFDQYEENASLNDGAVWQRKGEGQYDDKSFGNEQGRDKSELPVQGFDPACKPKLPPPSYASTIQEIEQEQEQSDSTVRPSRPRRYRPRQSAEPGSECIARPAIPTIITPNGVRLDSFQEVDVCAPDYAKTPKRDARFLPPGSKIRKQLKASQTWDKSFPAESGVVGVTKVFSLTPKAGSRPKDDNTSMSVENRSYLELCPSETEESSREGSSALEAQLQRSFGISSLVKDIMRLDEDVAERVASSKSLAAVVTDESFTKRCSVSDREGVSCNKSWVTTASIVTPTSSWSSK